MATHASLQQYLDQHGVPFEVQRHREAFTAQEIAALEHVPGRRFAKVVMVEADGRLVMLVLPACHRVNLWKVTELMGALEVRLAPEERFAGAFDDCEVGAMPPFGNLYHVPVFVDASLAEQETIVFESGSHTETIAMRYADFEHLVRPGVEHFAIPPARPRVAAA